MKTWKSVILIGIAILLNSCIVKSLQPFYTSDSLSYNEKFIGTWVDSEKGEWDIKSFKDGLKDTNISKKKIKTSEKDVKYTVKTEFTEFDSDPSDDVTNLTEFYKKGYLISYKDQDKEALFVAMPFKIDNQYFLDFIPFMYDNNSVNELVNQHLMTTHSVAKIDVNSDKEIAFSWLNENKVKELFDNKKLRLKHEGIGLEKDLLLTASSEELYVFLKKYMKSDIEDKWKKADMLTLIKANAKP